VSPEPLYGHQFEPAGWDITGNGNWGRSGAYADHGPNCEPPGHDGSVEHEPAEPKDFVYRCANHVMTVAHSGGVGAIMLTPLQVVDLSDGPVTIRFDISSYDSSNREYPGLWIQAYGRQLTYPDMQGASENSLHIREDDDGGQWNRLVQFFDGGKALGGAGTTGNFDRRTLSVDPEFGSAQQRQTIEIVLSKTHVTVTLLENGHVWIDRDLARPLDYDLAVVSFEHWVYNGSKGCMESAPCVSTWHWDNFMLTDSRPLTEVRTTAQGGYKFNWSTPREREFPFASVPPAGSFLRGDLVSKGDLEISFDGGATWETARLQPTVRRTEDDNKENGRPTTIWHPIPAGTTSVWVRPTVEAASVYNVSAWSLD
jgi:hypothetical protein